MQLERRHEPEVGAGGNIGPASFLAISPTENSRTETFRAVSFRGFPWRKKPSVGFRAEKNHVKENAFGKGFQHFRRYLEGRKNSFRPGRKTL